MPQNDPETLKKYKEYVKKRLAEFTPILQKTSMGDFSSDIKVPQKEDEFSELLAGLTLMIDDLRELERARKEVEEINQKRLAELEKWSKFTTGRELKMVELKKEIKDLKEALANANKT